ncbi:MAG: four helix bundle protein [Candidatus Marinimicrobia bacterium]|nr:four helix bundle protein [Candidatus Neomarinimicrobiota bacterium]
MAQRRGPFDLEDRLIQYAIKILTLVENLPTTSIGNHIGHQLLRSGTAPAAVYGEAQSAESRKDFTHKMKISLKELRESHVWLKIIKHKPLVKETGFIDSLLNETNELISIFVTSINTAIRNIQK